MIDHADFARVRQLIHSTRALIEARKFWKCPKGELKKDMAVILDGQLRLLDALQNEALKIERAAAPRNRDDDELRLEDD